MEQEKDIEEFVRAKEESFQFKKKKKKKRERKHNEGGDGEKLQELRVLLENFGGFLRKGLEKVFPADWREEKVCHWIQNFLQKQTGRKRKVRV